jgi:ACT domain-containing protein
MAKKVVATLRTDKKAQYTKVIKPYRSSKTGAYKFKEVIVPSEQVKEFLQQKFE